MGAQLRIFRQRIRSVKSTAKITRAQELIASSRIIKAQQRTVAAQPYARAITRAVTALVSQAGTVDHPLLTEKKASPTRSAVVLLTSDRGFAGGFNANILREGEALTSLLREEGSEVVPYVSGRKGVTWYKFRNRALAGEWSGFSDRPTYDDAKAIADVVIEAFKTPTEEGGVDEIHLVYTEFVSMLTQRVVVRRILPLEVEEVEEGSAAAAAAAAAQGGGPLPQYDYEPDEEEVLDALLPRYVESRFYYALLTSAASEFAARRRAMKSATDNANELVDILTRSANQARQAEITQEISEIVGGANALADATAGSE
ncbi:F0F1 ATP synthase subunit gamma [Sporichthya brevicatena]|uniref:ATP synthase gamma chain n=1 Tax=Sporichthya brevicatena TaxID=171442 RepID=A0ABP3SD69_9ACTN